MISAPPQERTSTVPPELAVDSTSSQSRLNRLSTGRLVVIGAAVVALCLKVIIAFNTIGTNDVVTFYQFGKALHEHGLEWTYRHSLSFNHPPLTAYYLSTIYNFGSTAFCKDNSLTFPFLLRLPGIFADFIVVLALCSIKKSSHRDRIPWWALTAFALSPVSIMICGFHGNTDGVMVMFLVLSCLFCLRLNPALCGLMLALSCQVKIIPLLMLPIFFCFWLTRRRAAPFLTAFLFVCVVLWSQPLLNFPALFLRNVLSYGSFWGIWGITYLLRMTGLPQFGVVTFQNLPPAENAIATVLKTVVVLAVLCIAWRRRKFDAYAQVQSIGYAWIVFFVFAPGVCAQYLVWLAPFMLLLSTVLFASLLATSSLFLFVFYDTIAHGLPWYSGVSTNNLNSLWTPWSVWPWAVLVVALFFLWEKALAQNASLSLFSHKPVS